MKTPRKSLVKANRLSRIRKSYFVNHKSYMSKIILTADDFGACDYIDSGIKRALLQKRINSVATFVCFPDSHERIENLLAFRRNNNLEFGIGLHFSVTAGFPLTNTDSLVKDPTASRPEFHDPADFFDGGNYQRADVSVELHEQIETLEAILLDAGYSEASKRIDSVSNHHGAVYIDNRLFGDYVNVIQSYGIPIRSAMPWSKSVLQTSNVDRQIFNPAVREGISLGFYRRAYAAPFIGRRVALTRQRNLNSTYCLLDEFYGQPSETYLRFLISQYRGKTFSSEFMFHLGDPALRPGEEEKVNLPGINFDYFPAREQELDHLMAIDLQSLLNAVGAIPCTFRDLAPVDSHEPR